VYGFGESSKGELRASLFMECMQSTLFSFAVENGQDGASKIKRPFSRGDSLDILLQIADAMEYIHTNGFIHGDLKPQNILMSVIEISGNVGHFLAKVADFGDARFISNDEDEFKPTGFGTTHYAAPELLNSRRNQGSTFRFPSKIDVFSFGCVAYEVLTGYSVHDGRLDIERVIARDLKPSDYQVWRTLIDEFRYPLGFIELIESCWELDPKKRPSFSHFCDELEKFKPNVVSLVSIHYSFICLMVFK
jgi:serine/threonine protein kinase